MNVKAVGNFVLPMVGIVLAGLVWWVASMYVADLPSPVETWDESQVYIMEPWAKRGEMDQGIARLAITAFCASRAVFCSASPSARRSGFCSACR